eukprot:snap_masked-scaffold_49-processed-gene-1.57-mRNA-1 protein AED:1.00 eAED:1.00 QI:0/-1/0/0/-1/1/1/0/281
MSETGEEFSEEQAEFLQGALLPKDQTLMSPLDTLLSPVATNSAHQRAVEPDAESTLCSEVELLVRCIRLHLVECKPDEHPSQKVLFTTIQNPTTILNNFKIEYSTQTHQFHGRKTVFSFKLTARIEADKFQYMLLLREKIPFVSRILFFHYLKLSDIAVAASKAKVNSKYVLVKFFESLETKNSYALSFLNSNSTNELFFESSCTSWPCTREGSFIKGEQRGTITSGVHTPNSDFLFFLSGNIPSPSQTEGNDLEELLLHFNTRNGLPNLILRLIQMFKTE